MTQLSLNVPTHFGRIASTLYFPARRTRILKRIVGLGAVGLLLLVLGGCGSVTVFQSNFDSNAVGAAPTHNQLTGTIDVSPPGSVVIVNAPPTATGKWAQISRAADPGAPISTMQCTLSQFQKDGSYSLAAVLFIPSGSGLATVEFDTSPQAGPPSTGFLHLDFGDFTVNNVVRKNTVRIDDDDNQLFGTFRRDQFFSVTVGMDITSSSAMAHVNLFGTGASGAQDINIVTATTPLFLAEQFGEVKFFMGSPWSGSFDTTTILVTRKR